MSGPKTTENEATRDPLGDVRMNVTEIDDSTGIDVKPATGFVHLARTTCRVPWPTGIDVKPATGFVGDDDELSPDVFEFIQSMIEGGITGVAVETEDDADGWELVGEAVRLLRERNLSVNASDMDAEPLLIPDFSEEELRSVGIETTAWPDNATPNSSAVNSRSTELSEPVAFINGSLLCLNVSMEKIPYGMAQVFVLESSQNANVLLEVGIMNFEPSFTDGREVMSGEITLGRLFTEKERVAEPDRLWIIPVDPRNAVTSGWLQRGDIVRLFDDPRIEMNHELQMQIVKLLDAWSLAQRVDHFESPTLNSGSVRVSVAQKNESGSSLDVCCALPGVRTSPELEAFGSPVACGTTATVGSGAAIEAGDRISVTAQKDAWVEIVVGGFGDEFVGTGEAVGVFNFAATMVTVGDVVNSEGKSQDPVTVNVEKTEACFDKSDWLTSVQASDDQQMKVGWSRVEWDNERYTINVYDHNDSLIVTQSVCASNTEGDLCDPNAVERVLKVVDVAGLGEGGMGAVWKARNPKLDRVVAVKMVRNDEDLADAEKLWNNILVPVGPGGEVLRYEAMNNGRSDTHRIVRPHKIGMPRILPSDGDDSVDEAMSSAAAVKFSDGLRAKRMLSDSEEVATNKSPLSLMAHSGTGKTSFLQQVLLAGMNRARQSGQPLVIPTALLRDHLGNRAHKLLDGANAILNASRLSGRHADPIAETLDTLARQMKLIGWNGSLFEKIVRSLLPDTDGKLHKPLEATVAWAVSSANEAGQHCRRQIRDQLSEIATNWRASSASVWLLDEYGDGRRSIVPLITRNDHRSKEVLTHGYPVTDESGCGFIALAAHTGHGVAVSPIGKSNSGRYYKAGPSNTVSEISVPLTFASQRIGEVSQVRGVLDLQFCRHLTTKPDSDLRPSEQAQKDALRVTPDLVVLDCLRRGNATWCPWHPERHGWDFRKSLETLCHDVCDAIFPDGVTLTIWYADWERDRLFVYSTDGYDFEYRDRRELDIPSSVTGKALLAGDELKVIEYPAVDFIEHEKAEAMGIHKAFIAPIPCPGSNPGLKDDAKRRPLGTVNLYFYGDSKDQVEAQLQIGQVASWLPTFARFVGQMGVAYDSLRRNFAVEVLEQKLEEQPVDRRSTKTHFDVLREFLRTVYGERVKISLWARWESLRDCVYCVGTDGLYRPNPPRSREHTDCTVGRHGEKPYLEDALGPMFYDLDLEAHCGLTTTLGHWEQSLHGESRKSSLRLQIEPEDKDRGESKSTRFSHRFREHFGIERNYSRWVLGATVKDSQKQKAVGVIRVVRAESCKPFTRCDEELLTVLANSSSWLFEWWQDEMRQFLQRGGGFSEDTTCDSLETLRVPGTSEFDSISEPSYSLKSHRRRLFQISKKKSSLMEKRRERSR